MQKETKALEFRFVKKPKSYSSSLAFLFFANIDQRLASGLLNTGCNVVFPRCDIFERSNGFIAIIGCLQIGAKCSGGGGCIASRCLEHSF